MEQKICINIRSDFRTLCVFIFLVPSAAGGGRTDGSATIHGRRYKIISHFVVTCVFTRGLILEH